MTMDATTKVNITLKLDIAAFEVLEAAMTHFFDTDTFSIPRAIRFPDVQERELHEVMASILRIRENMTKVGVE